MHFQLMKECSVSPKHLCCRFYFKHEKITHLHRNRKKVDQTNNGKKIIMIFMIVFSIRLLEEAQLYLKFKLIYFHMFLDITNLKEFCTDLQTLIGAIVERNGNLIFKLHIFNQKVIYSRKKQIKETDSIKTRRI